MAELEGTNETNADNNSKSAGEGTISTAAQHENPNEEKEEKEVEDLSLDNRYLYQNPTTGNVSSTTLAVRQLCRMFSPPNTNAGSTRKFTAETRVLALLRDGVTYDPVGWRAARDVPVLKHAAINSIYYTTAGAPSPQGPISCRKLSALRFQQRHQQETETMTDSSIDPERDQVFGESTGNQWRLIKNVPDLEMALEAFRDQNFPTPKPATANKSTNDDEAKDGRKTMPEQQAYDVSVMIYEDDTTSSTAITTTATAAAAVTGSEGNNNNQKNSTTHEKEVQDELEAFLSSTDNMMGPRGGGGGMMMMSGSGGGNAEAEDDDDEAYESDGGTKYVKDLRTGNWIHHSLAPPRARSTATTSSRPKKKVKIQHNNNNNGGQPTTTKININKKKGGGGNKFKAKNAKCWIYVTGLPPDTTEEELAKFFSKVGIIDLDPINQRPKIKLYKHKKAAAAAAAATATNSSGEDGKVLVGTCKGDASICYARPESVALALQVLDEAPFRDYSFQHQQQGSSNNNNKFIVRVQRAKFEQQGEAYYDQKKRVSQAQRKVARMAVKQARDWDDGEFNGRITGGLKGLRIIVLKGLFHPATDFGRGRGGSVDEEKEDAMLAELESNVRRICEDGFDGGASAGAGGRGGGGGGGDIEKITVFSKNSQGVMVIKFAQPGAASDAVKAWDGRKFTFNKKERKVEATFWDGVEDFTIRDEEQEKAEMERRHDAFGEWIESHGQDELPEELRLRVEK